MAIALDTLTIATATALETHAVLRAAPALRVVEVGIALSRARGEELGDVVISCGVAGGLRDDLPTGTIVVPNAVLRPNGETVACDPELAESLAAAARRHGSMVERGPLVTEAGLVRGSDRAYWACRGYVAADMETGLIRAQRLAAVRVILDSPARELSAAWLRPMTVFMRPSAWPQVLWLAREGPRCARLAATVLAAAFS